MQCRYLYAIIIHLEMMLHVRRAISVIFIVIQSNRLNQVKAFSLSESNENRITIHPPPHNEYPYLNTDHRRQVLSSLAIMTCSSLVLLLPRVSPSYAIPLQEVCAGGALMPEQAIPGAYQQECMELPVRIISLQKSVSDSPNSFSVIQLEIEQASVGAGSTGVVVWNSSLLLTRLLERLHQSEGDYMSLLQRVVELGCGPGLASLALACLQPSIQVTATDGNPNVVDLCRRNIQRNHQEAHVVASRLQWGEFLDDESMNEAFDLILGSDLTYNSGSWRVLAATMANLAQSSKGYILYVTLGHTGFVVQAEMEGFLSVAKQYSLWPVQPGDEDWPFHTQHSLNYILMNDCLRHNEREIVDATGGAYAVLLHKRIPRKRPVVQKVVM
jgi:predicted nicotinamide N-methyase